VTESWRAPRGALPSPLWVYRCPVCGFRAEWPRIKEHVMDAHPTWGGPRPGAGRPPTGTALRSLTVRLTPEQIERLRELGDGNASAGVRRLLAAVDAVPATTGPAAGG
jgi:hypothetical protein